MKSMFEKVHDDIKNAYTICKNIQDRKNPKLVDRMVEIDKIEKILSEVKPAEVNRYK